jgi:hypothetical protein
MTVVFFTLGQTDDEVADGLMDAPPEVAPDPMAGIEDAWAPLAAGGEPVALALAEPSARETAPNAMTAAITTDAEAVHHTRAARLVAAHRCCARCLRLLMSVLLIVPL